MHRSAASSRNLRHPPHRVPEMIGCFGPFQGHTRQPHIPKSGEEEHGGASVVDMQSRQSAMAPWPCRGPFPGHDCSPHEKSRSKTSRGPIRAGTFLTADPVRPGFREWPVCPPRPPTFSGDAPGLKVASGPDTAASIDLYDPSTTHHPPAATRRISRNRPVITPQRFCRRSLSSQLSIQSLPPSPRPDPRPHPGTSTSQAIDISQDGTAADRILSRRDPYLRQLPLWPLKF